MSGKTIFFKTCDKAVFKFIPERKKNIILYKHLEKSFKERKIKSPKHLEKSFKGRDMKCLITDFLKKLIIVTGQKGHLQLDKLISAEICEQDKIQIDNEDYNLILHHFKTPLER